MKMIFESVIARGGYNLTDLLAGSTNTTLPDG